ncbi:MULTISPECIES: hypothetical protein [Burkholderia]|uniref:hypothetical protein n=1 Tax=Burkholderia TaxID=32008 RepID=UPI0013DDA934|nr:MULTISPECIES: hypothetical protein [Burkholderia]MCA8298161.1 hypothetical protein [Burkholderia sp. AU30198]
MSDSRAIFLILPLISACVTGSFTDLPARSSRQILADIKAVVDSGDLQNVEFVASRLRINYKAGAKNPVYGHGERLIVGFGVDVREISSSNEYSGHGADYRIYWPEGRDFYRAGLSFSINGDVICATPYDLVDVFGIVERYPIAHWSRWGYAYENSAVNSSAAFSIDMYGCVNLVGVSMNRERR